MCALTDKQWHTIEPRIFQCQVLSPPHSADPHVLLLCCYPSSLCSWFMSWRWECVWSKRSRFAPSPLGAWVAWDFPLIRSKSLGVNPSLSRSLPIVCFLWYYYFYRRPFPSWYSSTYRYCTSDLDDIPIPSIRNNAHPTEIHQSLQKVYSMT